MDDLQRVDPDRRHHAHREGVDVEVRNHDQVALFAAERVARIGPARSPAPRSRRCCRASASPPWACRSFRRCIAERPDRPARSAAGAIEPGARLVRRRQQIAETKRARRSHRAACAAAEYSASDVTMTCSMAARRADAGDERREDVERDDRANAGVRGHDRAPRAACSSGSCSRRPRRAAGSPNVATMYCGQFGSMMPTRSPLAMPSSASAAASASDCRLRSPNVSSAPRKCVAVPSGRCTAAIARMSPSGRDG